MRIKIKESGKTKDVNNFAAKRLIADGEAVEVKAEKAPKKDKKEKTTLENKGK